MTEHESVEDRAAAKMLAIVESAVRMARARMNDELTDEERAALMAGPPPKMPPALTIENHLASALFDDAKGR